ncbi:MAG: polysaccharide deacetylase family protein [Oscillospiraceae bacterium]|nr:polysaccharide deacetylase family protein [Oscillospiraceae bacterium]
MKRSLRALCLGVALLLLCTVFPAAAGTDTVLMMQVGTGALLENGVSAAAPAPIYADNGALLIPLRPIAQRLGAAVGWDAPSRQTTVSRNGVTLRFTDQSWSYQAGGETKSLSAQPRVVNGTLYVPVLALTDLGVSVHVWGYYEGGFCAVSDRALSDAALAQYHAQALKAFGPNEGLFNRTSLTLRLGSRKAWTGGGTVELCEKGGAAVPYQGSDGFLMLPVQACAEALGGTYALDAAGNSTVTLGGHTAVFPAANGYVTVDGARREHAYYGGALRQGTAFCSVYAFASTLGYCAYADGDAILLSAWDLSQRPAFQERAWQAADALILQRYEDAKGFLALTFDDGPSGQLTTRLLDGLKARGVHATFFLCDYRIQTYPGILGRYRAEGHEVGNHSANHATLTACGAEKLASELDATNRSITRLCGAAPTLMRPPGGAYNQTVLSAAGARGMSCIMWSVDTLDWKNRNVSAILQRALPNVRDGDIILMHDMYSTSVDAALSMIDTLQAQGYVFVTVSELAQLKGVSLQPGASYSSIR